MRPLTLCFAAALATTTGTARAQTLTGAHRLSLDGTAYVNESATLSVNGRDSSFSGTQYGLFGAGLGAGYGYGISPSMVVGAHVAHAHASISSDNVTSEQSTLWVLPTIEFYLATSGRARPYVAPAVGATITSASSNGQDLYTWTSLAAGANVGVHIFATDTFSIAPYGGVFVTSGTGDFGGTAVDRKSVVVLLAVSVAGWLGMKPEAPAAAPASTPSEPPPPPPARMAPPRPPLSVAAGEGGRTVSLLPPPVRGTRRVRVILGLPGGQDALATCGAMTIIAGEKRTESVAERMRTGKNGADAGLSTYVSVDAFGEPPAPLRFEACGETWTADRAPIDAFVGEVSSP